MFLAYFTNRNDEDSNSHDFSNYRIICRVCDGFRSVVYNHKGIHDAIEGAIGCGYLGCRSYGGALRHQHDPKLETSPRDTNIALWIAFEYTAF